VPDTFDPDPDGGNRLRRRMAIAYAIAAALILVACCYGGYWFSAFARDVVLELTH
jgi:hypothetical protein